MHIDHEETIAAISTPPGSGGIGIIRISGERALEVLRRIFKPASSSCDYSSHKLYYGHIVDPDIKKILDEVMAVFMKAPNTYTREDVVEIQCHGSFLVLNNILECILTLGVTLAAPGEFTKRAFLNGRIDLTRAEAVIDVLSARTRKGVDLAQQQLSGALYKKIDAVRLSLTQMRALIEVAIDFPDEDIEIVDHSQLLKQLQDEVATPIRRLLAHAAHGKVYREGISVVIAGLPNVGKSSLLNSLLQEERALVTEIPGTTRDTIEEYLDINGVPVRIIDTAGIREDAEAVEQLGIRRAKSLINEADLVLFMVDSTRGMTEADELLFQEVNHKPLVMVANKIDLPDSKQECFGQLPDDVTGLFISARTHSGIDELKKAIFSKVISGTEQWEEEGCAPNIRHKLALARAEQACERVEQSLLASLTSDLIAVDIQECLDQLNEIVGETTTEDILDIIFEQFCLGK